MSPARHTPNDRSYIRHLAGAPISWGICEVPGWGVQMSAGRILPEMRDVGIRSTELGPPGFLGHTTDAIGAALGEHDLELIGAFVPLVLHDAAGRDAMRREADGIASNLAALGATRFVTAVVVDPGWSPRRALTSGEWETMFRGFSDIDAICGDYGLVQAIHPHVGTLVETRADVELVLANSDVRWTLDTGHLMIGGTDPVQFAIDNFDRVAHVHLKDVSASIATRLNAGDLTLFDAVREGIFTPLGQGDVAIADVLDVLDRGGYEGWYVLEQDVAIVGDEPAPGTGPIDAVRASVAYLQQLALA